MRTTRSLIEVLETRQLLAAISGRVFEDRNNDGSYTPSPDLGVTTTVYLDTNNNGVFDTGETGVATSGMTSGNWGAYTFSNLAVGTYHVRAVVPTSFAQTYPLNNAALDVTLTNPSFTTLDSNIGLRNLTQKSRLAGRVYADMNKNGARESTEAYLGDVRVFNDSDNDGVFDAGEESTLTNSSGTFTLDVLNPSYTTTYRVRAVAPSGLTQTTQHDTNGAYVQTADAGTVFLPSDLFGFADVTPPQVTAATLEIDARPHAIRFNLSEPLGQVPFQLSLLFTVKRIADLNGPTNVTLPPGSFTLSTATPGVLRYTLNTSASADGLLPDGLYTATIPSNSLVDAAGNTNPSAYTFQFHVLRGDANGDRIVNFDDLIILAQNYNKTSQTFAKGNFDFSPSGAVNFDDLILLAQRYNKGLQAPPAALSILTPATDDTSSPTKRRRKPLVV